MARTKGHIWLRERQLVNIFLIVSPVCLEKGCCTTVEQENKTYFNQICHFVGQWRSEELLNCTRPQCQFVHTGSQRPNNLDSLPLNDTYYEAFPFIAGILEYLGKSQRNVHGNRIEDHRQSMRPVGLSSSSLSSTAAAAISGMAPTKSLQEEVVEVRIMNAVGADC